MKRKEVSQFPSETMSSKPSKSGIRKVGYAVTCSRFVFFSQMHILVEREAMDLGGCCLVMYQEDQIHKMNFRTHKELQKMMNDHKFSINIST